MRRTTPLLTAFAVAALVLAPAMSDARPGGGGSIGSRGSRTYSMPPSTSTSPGYARPMERSMTNPGATNPGGSYGSTPYSNPGANGSYVQPRRGGLFGGGFGAGLLGGLIGAGLGGMLFGHGFTGGLGGFGSFIGLLLQLAILYFVVRWAFSWFRRRQSSNLNGPVPAGLPGGMARNVDGERGRPNYGGGGGAVPQGGAVTVSPADYEAFERTLKEVNAAWTRGDLPALQRLCTPEMVSYFNEEMSDLASRGLRNETRDVALRQGDLSESWREGRRDYASVAMRFSLIDVTRRVSDGAVVEGDPNRPTEATELWTFLRSDGGQWVLSAIQQVG